MCVPVKIIMWTHLLPSHIVCVHRRPRRVHVCDLWDRDQTSKHMHLWGVYWIYLNVLHPGWAFIAELFIWVALNWFLYMLVQVLFFVHSTHTHTCVQTQRNYENFSNTHKIKPNVCFTFNYICLHGIMSQFRQKWNQILTHAWFSQNYF